MFEIIILPIFEIIILAIALSMDAFAVAIGLGAKKNTPFLALRAGIFFGVFQAIMPLIGYFAGKSVVGWVQAYTDWIAFGLLTFVGANMVYESLQGDFDAAATASVTNKVLLILATATSIDAMAAGFSLNLLPVNPYTACLLIGVITFAFSVLGVWIGKHSGTKLESKAGVFGGIVLIAMGIKFLIV
jgi:manganese efflux pump family protein